MKLLFYCGLFCIQRYFAIDEKYQNVNDGYDIITSWESVAHKTVSWREKHVSFELGEGVADFVFDVKRFFLE